ncbi:unnamed protein product, partial [Scytosiphon promiscuus]
SNLLVLELHDNQLSGRPKTLNYCSSGNIFDACSDVLVEAGKIVAPAGKSHPKEPRFKAKARRTGGCLRFRAFFLAKALPCLTSRSSPLLVQPAMLHSIEAGLRLRR